MPLIRHCIVDMRSNKVVNIIDYDSVVSTKPPGLDSDLLCIPSETGQVGFDYLNGELVDNTPAQPVVNLSYVELRAAAYPPVTDYLDGIVKGDTAQVQKYIDACLAVKAKYPKPE